MENVPTPLFEEDYRDIPYSIIDQSKSTIISSRLPSPALVPEFEIWSSAYVPFMQNESESIVSFHVLGSIEPDMPPIDLIKAKLNQFTQEGSWNLCSLVADCALEEYEDPDLEQIKLQAFHNYFRIGLNEAMLLPFDDARSGSQIDERKYAKILGRLEYFANTNPNEVAEYIGLAAEIHAELVARLDHSRFLVYDYKMAKYTYKQRDFIATLAENIRGRSEDWLESRRRYYRALLAESLDNGNLVLGRKLVEFGIPSSLLSYEFVESEFLRYLGKLDIDFEIRKGLAQETLIPMSVADTDLSAANMLADGLYGVDNDFANKLHETVYSRVSEVATNIEPTTDIENYWGYIFDLNPYSRSTDQAISELLTQVALRTQPDHPDKTRRTTRALEAEIKNATNPDTAPSGVGTDRLIHDILVAWDRKMISKEEANERIMLIEDTNRLKLLKLENLSTKLDILMGFVSPLCRASSEDELLIEPSNEILHEIHDVLRGLSENDFDDRHYTKLLEALKKGGVLGLFDEYWSYHEEYDT